MNENTNIILKHLALIDNMDDVRRVQDALRDATNRAQRTAQRSFAVGDSVSFDDGRGNVLTGKVTKKLQKNVKVAVPGAGEWRVSPSLLNKA